MNNSKNPLALATAAVLALAANAGAQSIGLNFLHTEDISFGATGAGAPDYAQPNWNHFQTDWSGNLENDALFAAGLVDSTGASVAGVLENITSNAGSDPVHYDSNNTWQSGAGNADANATLMNGYLDDGSDNQPYVNLSLADGVYPVYTVVLYVNGDGQNSAVGRYWLEEWIDPLAEGTVITDQVGVDSNSYAGTFVQAGADFPQTNAPTDVAVAEGNYIVFSGITARNLRIRSSGNGDPEDYGRGPLNAVQIVTGTDDSDGDGLPDAWEIANMLDPNDDGTTNPENGANGDPDSDGVTNLQEFQRGGNPRNGDTDADGLGDGVETDTGVFVDATDTGTSPTDPDSDGDGLTDDVETATGVFVDATNTGSDPNIGDSDADTLPDGWEVANTLDPNDDGTTAAENGAAGDPDADTSPNSAEFAAGTDPRDADSDDDTVIDGHEDNGGLWISPEIRGTDPLDPDSDNDALPDGVETNTMVFVDATDTGTDPNLRDSDADGSFDGGEVAAGTDPTNLNSTPAFPPVIGYWPFDDQNATATADLSANDNAATLVGGPVYVAGHTGAAGDFALSFDGVDDATTAALSLNELPEFTMSGWVQFDTEQAARTGFFGQNDVVEFGMIAADTLQLYTPVGGAIDVAFGPTTVWTHVAVVGDATGRSVYINGVSVGTGVTGTPLAASDFPFNIGGAGIIDIVGNFFAGEIDDVAVWDIALDPTSIAGLASGEITPIVVTPTGDLKLGAFSYDPVANTATLIVENTTPGETYALEMSPDLTLNSWNEVTDFVGADGGTTTQINFNGPDPRLSANYYRVQVIE